MFLRARIRSHQRTRTNPVGSEANDALWIDDCQERKDPILAARREAGDARGVTLDLSR